MAEVVEYRLEKTINELDFLSEFKVISKSDIKNLLDQRRNFEYKISKRKREKLDFLKYIKFECNFVKFLEDYRKKLASNKVKLGEIADDPIQKKIFLLKLSQLIRERYTHIGKLYRKLVITFQFDTDLWLAYIEFASSKKWNSRVSALYWRLLRIKNDDPTIWIAAAEHEVERNKAYEMARKLYLRALRHHPKDVDVWINYFNMEVRYMKIINQRKEIIFKLKEVSEKSEDAEGDIDDDDCWDEDPNKDEEMKPTDDDDEQMKPITDDDDVVKGTLAKLVYKQALDVLNDTQKARFLKNAEKIISNASLDLDDFKSD